MQSVSLLESELSKAGKYTLKVQQPTNCIYRELIISFETFSYIGSFVQLTKNVQILLLILVTSLGMQEERTSFEPSNECVRIEPCAGVPRTVL